MTYPDDDNWFTCPQCGAVVPSDAEACPECGSCDETGWSDDAAYDGLDLPTDYGEEEPPIKIKSGFWNIVAVFVLIMLILLVMFGLF
jgi:uncharacterized membrane protein YvbJ